MGHSSSTPTPPAPTTPEPPTPPATTEAPTTTGGMAQVTVQPGERVPLGALVLAAPSRTASVTAFKEYRDKLLGFSLGESAYDYVETLYADQPHSPEVMALLAETATMYDSVKNKHMRKHWVDRMDLLQRAIDVSRQCISEHPDFGPCHRTFILAAVRASEASHFGPLLRPLGPTKHYQSIMEKGQKAMTLNPDDGEIPNALASLAARSAYSWPSPYRLWAFLHGVPCKAELLNRAVELSSEAVRRDSGNLEFACRLAQAHYFKGDLASARRWFVKVRDSMVPRSLKDQRWQSIAHTQLTTGFDNSKWNVPLG